MDSNSNTQPNPNQEPPTTKLEAEQIMEASETVQPGAYVKRGPHATAPIPPIPPIPPQPDTPPQPTMPPFPFMGDMSKDDMPKGEQVKRQPSGKKGEVRFATTSLNHPSSLVISSLSGDIHVRGTEQDYISVTVFHDDEPMSLEDVAEVIYTEEGELRIKAMPLDTINRQMRSLREAWRGTKSNFFDNISQFVEQVSVLGRGWGAMDFNIVVPTNCDLQLNNTSGEISVSGVSGTMSLQAVSGEVEVKKLSGNISVQTRSGEITAHDLNGTIYLRSISGDLEVQQAEGNLVLQSTSGDADAHNVTGKLGFKSISGNLELHDSELNSFYLSSTSGDLNVDATLHPGEYEIRTVSGDTTLNVQRNFSARVTGRTLSGDFHCDLPYIPADEDWQSNQADAASGEPETTGPNGEYNYEYRTPGYRYEYQGDPRSGKGRGHEERRRRRNRWEFLIGDPATASNGQTRLRIRTTSGDVNIEQGRRHTQGKASDAINADDFTRPLRSDEANIARMTEGDGYHRDEDTDELREKQLHANRERTSANRERTSANRERTSANQERTRADILRAVERKEISVEEAMRLLKQID